MILPKLGSEAVCWFGVFDVSPKGTEAKVSIISIKNVS
jgi:hypothetical protein